MKFEIIENEGLELIGIVKKIEMKKGAEECPEFWKEFSEQLCIPMMQAGKYRVSTAGLWCVEVVDYHWSLRRFMAIPLPRGGICLARMCHFGRFQNSFSTRFVPTTGELEHEKIAVSKCG